MGIFIAFLFLTKRKINILNVSPHEKHLLKLVYKGHCFKWTSHEIKTKSHAKQVFIFVDYEEMASTYLLFFKKGGGLRSSRLALTFWHWSVRNPLALVWDFYSTNFNRALLIYTCSKVSAIGMMLVKSLFRQFEIIVHVILFFCKWYRQCYNCVYVYFHIELGDGICLHHQIISYFY